MEFKAARCPSCSGELRLDPSIKRGFCAHCGSELIVEEAIKRVQVDGIAPMDNLIILAEEEREAGNLKEALKYYKRVLELDPYHYKARYEMALIDIEKTFIYDLKLHLTNSLKALKYDLELTHINSRFCEAKKWLEFAIKNAPQNEREELQQWRAMELRESALTMFEKSTNQHSQMCKKNTDGYTISIECKRYYKTLKYLIMKIELSSLLNPDLMVTNNKTIVNFIEAFLNERIEHGRLRRIDADFFSEMLSELGKILKEKEEEILRHDSSYKRLRDRRTGWCYIATAVYGSYNAPQVIVLRQYRDEVLSKTTIGQLFIMTYYVLSPPLAKRVKDIQVVNRLARFLLDGIVKKLE